MGSWDLRLKMNEMFNERYTPPVKFGCHISQKMTAKNALKGQTQNTLISTQQRLFFVLLSVYAKGMTDPTNYGVPIN